MIYSVFGLPGKPARSLCTRLHLMDVPEGGGGGGGGGDLSRQLQIGLFVSGSSSLWSQSQSLD